MPASLRALSYESFTSFPNQQMADKINVAIVGLGFGAEFIPIYQRHPHANLYAICQRDPKKLDAIGDAFDIEKRYTDFKDVLKDPNVDAVHINSPIPDHGWMSIAAHEAFLQFADQFGLALR